MCRARPTSAKKYISTTIIVHKLVTSMAVAPLIKKNINHSIKVLCLLSPLYDPFVTV